MPVRRPERTRALRTPPTGTWPPCPACVDAMTCSFRIQRGVLPRKFGHRSEHQSRAVLRRRALPTTLTDDNAMGGRDDRRQQNTEERVEHGGRNGNSDRVVDEREDHEVK